MKKIIKCDLSILQTLKTATKEEVDFLVDVITDNGSGRVGLSSSIKDMLLSEKQEPQYSEDALRYLIREFHAFGGHTVANVFRKEPVNYDEILRDVHGKLNGRDSKNKSTHEKEEEIVLGLFGAEWRALSAPERFERTTEPSLSTGFFQLPNSSPLREKGAAFGLAAALSLTMLPVAVVSSVALVTQKTIGEAYRITIPYVAQIAWIRMRQSNNVA